MTHRHQQEGRHTFEAWKYSNPAASSLIFTSSTGREVLCER